jgi:Sulfotransferase family.
MHKLFFFHLPKAGGTSITAALAANFDAAKVAPLIENDIQGHLDNRGDYQRFRGYDFYSGHYGIDVFNAVSDEHWCVTNFRHPVERIYSLYRYFRQIDVDEATLSQRHYAAVKAAKSSSLEEFVTSRDEGLRTYTFNQQARQLTGSPWDLEPNICMTAARTAIDRMSCFYVCEYPDQSSQWFKDVLGVEAIPRLNVTSALPSDRAVSASSAAIIESNQLDLTLYEHAVSSLHARCPA